MPKTIVSPFAWPASSPEVSFKALPAVVTADASEPDSIATRLVRAWEVLEAVPDPEIPVVSIRELGILREVRLAAPRSADESVNAADPVALEVVITPTYSGCPAMSQIAEDVERALSAAGLGPARIVTTLTPAWTTDWITPEARAKLRRYGIAPPGARAADTQPVQFIRARPALTPPNCPHCGSADTERLAQFGSTACKALYRCRACREPFDYFKPY